MREHVLGLADGEELHVVSEGDVRWSDVLAACVARAGAPCALRVSTLAASAADCRALNALGADLRVHASYDVLRLNGPRGRAVERELGPALRMARTHAKFAVTSGPRAVLSVLTTANLNVNRRCEHYLVTTDRWVGAHLLEVLADVERRGAEPGRDGAYYAAAFEASLGGMAPEDTRTLGEICGRWKA